MKCPLCGYKIDDKEVLSCKECVMRKDCKIRKCPNCGYSLMDTSKIEGLIDKIKQIIKKIKKII